MRPVAAVNMSSPASPPVPAGKVPVAVIFPPLTPTSSVTVPVSGVMTGTSSAPFIVIVTVAVSVFPKISVTVYVNVSVAVSPAFR